jgi:hypothetical protein
MVAIVGLRYDERELMRDFPMNPECRDRRLAYRVRATAWITTQVMQKR